MAWADCLHRGDVLRSEKADLCGRKGVLFDVYSCSVHGECAMGRFCKKQAVQSCVGCPDAQAGSDTAG